jgi:hypothetical protein
MGCGQGRQELGRGGSSTVLYIRPEGQSIFRNGGSLNRTHWGLDRLVRIFFFLINFLGTNERRFIAKGNGTKPGHRQSSEIGEESNVGM